MDCATGHWAGPPPKSPKATNPDRTRSGGMVVVVGSGGLVVVVGSGGSVVVDDDDEVEVAPSVVEVVDRRVLVDVGSTFPSDEDDELSRQAAVRPTTAIPVSRR